MVSMEDRVGKIIEEKDVDEDLNDEEFRELFLERLRQNHEEIPTFRKFMYRKGVDIDNVDKVSEVPGFPVSWFKKTSVKTDDENQTLHLSSGTSGQRSKVYRNKGTLNLLEKAFLKGVENMMQVNDRMVFLREEPEENPDSIGDFEANLLLEKFDPQYDFLVEDGSVDYEIFVEIMEECVSSGTPVTVMGQSVIHHHIMNYMEEEDLSYDLPEGSFMEDGGGYKTEEIDISKKEFIRRQGELFGVEPRDVVNSFGMTEVNTLFLDSSFLKETSDFRDRYKVEPPWTKVFVCDPESLKPVDVGETGFLKIVDLTHGSLPCIVQTYDIGRKKEDGFELLRKPDEVDLQSCGVEIQRKIRGDNNGD